MTAENAEAQPLLRTRFRRFVAGSESAFEPDPPFPDTVAEGRKTPFGNMVPDGSKNG